MELDFCSSSYKFQSREIKRYGMSDREREKTSGKKHRKIPCSLEYSALGVCSHIGSLFSCSFFLFVFRVLYLVVVVVVCCECSVVGFIGAVGAAVVAVCFYSTAQHGSHTAQHRVCMFGLFAKQNQTRSHL